mmetsp:Transcript_10900/g.32371  ORF Transcript_10900/g.32371 Transcript_10900/m.32371 type:complete len:373 (+) Transcript_10900:158-1276(+)
MAGLKIAPASAPKSSSPSPPPPFAPRAPMRSRSTWRSLSGSRVMAWPTRSGRGSARSRRTRMRGRSCGSWQSSALLQQDTQRSGATHSGGGGPGRSALRSAVRERETARARERRARPRGGRVSTSQGRQVTSLRANTWRPDERSSCVSVRAPSATSGWSRSAKSAATMPGASDMVSAWCGEATAMSVRRCRASFTMPKGRACARRAREGAPAAEPVQARRRNKRRSTRWPPRSMKQSCLRCSMADGASPAPLPTRASRERIIRTTDRSWSESVQSPAGRERRGSPVRRPGAAVAPEAAATAKAATALSTSARRVGMESLSRSRSSLKRSGILATACVGPGTRPSTWEASTRACIDGRPWETVSVGGRECEDM